MVVQMRIPVVLVVTLSLSQLVGDALAGSLVPTEPPGPTFKTLGEIEPRTVVNSDPLSQQPLVIDRSGSYVLAGNVVAIIGEHAISITADDVTLDLNGYTVRGHVVEKDNRSGISISGDNVTIRNGTVREAHINGIHCAIGGLTAALVEVNATHNGVGGASCDQLRVAGGNFSSNGGFGLGGDKLMADGVQANSNGSAGVAMSNESSLSRSMAMDNGEFGVTCAGGKGLVTATIAKGNGIFNSVGCAAFDSEMP